MPKDLVLVAEDEADIRQLLVDTLADAGFEVIQASDGGAALEMATRERPDVVLLDVMMPVMNGFKMLAELKADPSIAGIPVIMVTAKGQDKDAQKALLSGACAVVIKPWSHQQVETEITRALAARRLAA
ncbi:MAG: response regulator [Dehalococcoidia bacterium]|nr:response regulator [Dehalococcoidia bacterium]